MVYRAEKLGISLKSSETRKHVSGYNFETSQDIDMQFALLYSLKYNTDNKYFFDHSLCVNS